MSLFLWLNYLLTLLKRLNISMSFLNGFLDNVVSGALSPKGNLGDYAHGEELRYTHWFFALILTTTSFWSLRRKARKTLPLAPASWSWSPSCEENNKVLKQSLQRAPSFQQNLKRNLAIWVKPWARTHFFNKTDPGIQLACQASPTLHKQPSRNRKSSQHQTAIKSNKKW